MGFVEVEQAGKRIFEQFPVIKKSAKRVYQLASVATSKEKFKSEGDVSRVSPDDGYEYFYGYYDKSPWDMTDRYMICLKVKQAYKSVAPKEPGVVGVIDTHDNNKYRKIGITHSWNVQQGCMAQWMGPDYRTRILYNDFRDGKYCSVIYDFQKKKEEKVLPMAAYDVARDGSFILSLDFSRLHRMRPGYGYSNLTDTTKGELCPDKGCIWKVDVESGKIKELFKYTDFAAFEPDESMIGAEHKVNHLMISPNCKRFMVLHRWFQKGRKHTRLVTVNVDKTEMYNLSDDVFVSHCFWKNDDEILSFLRKKETGDHYYLMKDKTQEYKMYWPELNTDGHCSYSPDGKYIITDTYPNRKRLASVYLCTEEDNYSRRIARVFSPFRYDNECRCDLHPRWNRVGDKVCIDSVHEGKRGLYIVGLQRNLSKEIDEKYKYHKKNGNINVAAIKKQTDSYDYVSFDIFDTLIKRDVPSPQAVFTLTRRKFEKESGIKIKEFKHKRIEAEKAARDKASTPEVTIRDIYNNLQMDISAENKSRLMQTEIDVEKMLCVVNKPILDVYNYCIMKGKKVFIISNMYLPQDVVEEILSSAGYRSYEKLYLSCTCMLKKSDGRLFKLVLKEQGIKADQLLHIGDSWKTDYIQAKKIGMKAIHINKETDYLSHDGSKIEDVDKFDSACLRSFINNHIDLGKNDYYRFGYESFGLLLYGFNKWMVEDMRRRNITDVFFFSRDGHVIKRAFDIQYKNTELKGHYFYVSRRSLRVPQIWLSPEYEQVINVFPLAKLLTVETFIKNLGLDPEDYKDRMKVYNLTKETMLKKVELPDNAVMKSFYESIKEDVIVHSKEECTTFLDYMKQNGLKGEIAVVDIGWHGSLQYFIQQIADELKLDLTMHGYYIGLATEAKRQIDIQGYVVDKGSTTNSCDAWKPFNGLVENLFLAQEGSTEKFRRLDDGTVEPILYPYEYVDAEGNKEWEAIKVGSIQDGAIDFVRDVVESGIMDYLSYSSTTAFSNITETGVHPTRDDLLLFADFRFLEEQIDYLAQPRSLFHYAMHPHDLKMDIGFCRWKIGFMKELFRGMPLPYEKMYEVLRRASSEGK